MRYIFILFILLFSLSTLAQKNSNELLKAENQIATFSDVYFKFSVNNKLEIKKLPNFISVDHRTKHEKNTVYAYVHKTRFQDLLDLEIPFEVVSKGMNSKALTMATTVAEMANWDRYPTHGVYLQMMQNFATTYPDICRLETIGTSQNGRAIQVLKITDNPDIAENEPEFFYTGQMHGDELVASVMFLRLIDYLLSNYGTDSQVDNLINNVEIWINPLSNPDGCYQGGDNTVSGAMRELANGVDPNRNFPAPGNPHSDGNAYAQEIVDMMAFTDLHDFVLSANTHSGAEVVNYPWDMWDSTTQTHADDNWWQLVSHEYANTVFSNSSGSYFKGISSDGIIEGGDWYIVWGGRQDYMTALKNGREFTLELSGAKGLDAAQLPAHWNYNYNSFLQYIEQSLYGVRGVITDATTGEPIKAKIEVVGHDDDNSFVFSTLPVGNYNRLIYEGNYDLLITAPCYETKTISNISVTNFQATVVDVQLTPTGFASEFEADATSVQIGETVNFSDTSCGNTTSWSWTFEGATPSTSNDQYPTGIMYNTVGTYDVSLTVSDGTNTDTINKENYISVNNEYVIENTTVSTCNGIFYDSGAGAGSYANDEDYTMTFLPGVATDKITCNFQSFDIEDNSSCEYDWLKIYDGENTSASLIGTYCGTDSPGIIEATSASGALTFEFHSDSSMTREGWEALIGCYNPASVGDEAITNIKLYPNPVTDQVRIEADVAIVSVSVVNVNGACVAKKEFNTNQEKVIDLNAISPGIYIIKVMSHSEIYTTKLIKR